MDSKDIIFDSKDPLNPLNTNQAIIQGIHESCAVMVTVSTIVKVLHVLSDPWSLTLTRGQQEWIISKSCVTDLRIALHL